MADEIHFHGFKSGMPLIVCPDDSVLRTRLGDRIAVAYSARLPGVTRRINAVAFLNPIDETIRFLMRDVEVLSDADVVALAALPPTDAASPDGVSQDPDPGNGALPLLLLAAAASAVALLQRRRRLMPTTAAMGSEAP